MDPAMERLQAIFDRALTVPGPARAALLDAACAAPEERARVQDLLRADALAEAEGFLTAPAARPPAPDEDGLCGTRLGPYEVGALIGRGGMGRVYRGARVTDYRQDVAIKVTHGGAEMLARFRAERQLLAALDHPNIARLLDGGVTPDGRPYFVMELIDGERIDRHCAAARADYRARAALVAEACAAVGHAHECGVIHRDLKPGNILVTRAGAVRVVDFGLARREGDGAGGLTRTGEVLGTPGYMAPELADGRPGGVSPAADVYGLGATLYELLAGRPPFWAESPLLALRQAAEGEPIPPGRLAPGLPRDLETVCLKCLARDPAKRYPTARELGDDLARFLRGEAVRARRVGRAERLGRWARRHPATAALALALVLLLAGSFVAVTLLWRRAEARGDAAMDALELFLDGAEPRLVSGAPLTPDERAAYLRGLENYEGLLADSGGGPAARARTAGASRKAARLFHQIGEHEKALRLYERAVALYGRLRAECPGRPEYRLALSDCLMQRGNMLNLLSRPGEALGPFEQAVAEAEGLDEAFPGEDRYRGALAAARCQLARQRAQAGRLDEADGLLAQALPVLADLADRRPDDPDGAARLAGMLGLRAEVAARRGDLEALAAAYRRRVELCDVLRRRFPERPLLLNSLLNHTDLAGVLERLGRRAGADRAVRDGEQILRELTERFPAVAYYGSHLYSLREHVGFLHWQDDRPRAEAAFRAAAPQLRGLAEQFPQDPAFRRSLALLLATCPDPAVGDTAEALHLARQLRDERPDDLRLRTTLGIAECCAGEWEAAIPHLEGGAAFDDYEAQLWFRGRAFLVMACWRCGRREHAAEVLDELRAKAGREQVGVASGYFVSAAERLCREEVRR